MRRALAIALLALAAPAYAFAEGPTCGFAVYDRDGKFVTSRWPEEASFFIGRASQSLVNLEGLEPIHAQFNVSGRKLSVVPFGDVHVRGQRISKETHFTPEDHVLVGVYRFQFFYAPSLSDQYDEAFDEDAVYGVDDEQPEQAPVPPPSDEEDDGTVKGPVGILRELERAAGPDFDREKPPVPPDRAAEKAAAERKEEFANNAYRFCHDPDYGKNGTSGVDFCPIFDASSDEVCPEARKKCPEWQAMPLMCEPGKQAPREGRLREGEGEEDECLAGGRAKRKRIERRSSLPLFGVTVPPAVAYVLLGAALLIVLAWFIASLRSAGWERDERELAAQSITDAERNLQALPEARSNVLLRMAERALANGDAREGSILLHLAVLRHLDDEGLARYHPSKTNGDYLRAIRRDKPLAALFRGIANLTERIRFGDGHADAGALALLIDDGKRILVRRDAEAPKPEVEASGTAIALIALLSMSGSACGDDGRDPAYHSRSPTGMSALPKLLRETGMTVEIRRTRLGALDPDVGVLVIRSSASDEKHWPEALRLDATLDRGISVVVVDDLWRSSFFLPVTSSVSTRRGAFDAKVVTPSSDVFCSWKVAGLDELAEAPVRLPFGRRLLWNETAKTATVSAKQLAMHPILEWGGEPDTIDGKRAAIAWAADRVEHGTALGGCLYVFADRDLFTNASLTRTANARFVAGFFAALAGDGRKIVILDRLDAYTIHDAPADEDEAKQTPAKPLKASNMLPFLIQAGIALIALYVFVGAAFGPLRDPAVREHKAFIEHVEAIGRQYARTGVMGLTHAARSLARLVVMRHRDQVRGGTGGGWSGVAQHLSQKLTIDENDVKAALRLGIDGTSELGAPSPSDPSPSSEKMLRTLSRLLAGR